MPEENEVKYLRNSKKENISQRFLQLEKLTFECKEHRLVLTYNDPKNIVPTDFSENELQTMKKTKETMLQGREHTDSCGTMTQ